MEILASRLIFTAVLIFLLFLVWTRPVSIKAWCEQFLPTGKQEKTIELLLSQANKNKDLSRVFFIREISSYWIKDGVGAYKVGALFKVFNMDNTRAFVVNSLGYGRGEIGIKPQATAVIPEEYLNKNPFDSEMLLKSNIYIAPAKESVISFEFKDSIKITMTNEGYPPIIEFNVPWFIEIAREGVIRMFGKEGNLIVNTNKVIDRKEWERLIGA